jgi:APA family basic amino acid/polyamine antiporter
VAFARKASGLVRDVSARTAAMWNIGFLNFAIGAMVVWEWGIFVAPNADIYTGSIIAMIGGCALSAVYALFTAAMPRSGGDYVFTSRNLHPVLGFTVSWSGLIWILYLVGGIAYVTSVSFLPFMLQMLGYGTIAEMLVTPTWTFIDSMAIMVLAFLLLSFGMKIYMKVTWVIFFFSVAMVLIVLGLFATAGQAGFTSSFNAAAGSATAYQDILTNASKEGFTMGDATMATFFGMLPVLVWPIGWGGSGPSYIAGEIKDAHKVRSSLYVMCTTVVVMTVFVMLMTYFLDITAGRQWLSSLIYLYMTGSKSYPVASEPHYGYLTSLLTSNPILLFVLGAAWVLLGFNTVCINMLLPTRYMFAWSFDRLLPKSVTYVHPRLHSPIVANLIALVVGIIFFWLVYFSNLPWIGSLRLIMGNSTTGILIGFGIVALAGALLPYLRKDFYERSNIKIKVGPVPLITLVGILAIVYLIWNEAMFIWYTPLGTNMPMPLAFSFIMTFSGIPIYYVIKYINKRRGIDIGLLYREVPPA